MPFNGVRPLAQACPYILFIDRTLSVVYPNLFSSLTLGVLVTRAYIMPFNGDMAPAPN